MEFMGRSVLGGLDIWTFEYESEVVSSLLVTVWLSEVDVGHRTMLIEFITDSMAPDCPA